jgi:transcriptional regulator with XRE-family HTH domain
MGCPFFVIMCEQDTEQTEHLNKKMTQSELFSKRLSQCMGKQGETLRSLGSKVGVSFSTISRWQNGTIPRKTQIAKLADALGVDPEWLIGKQTEQNSTDELPKASDRSDRRDWKRMCTNLLLSMTSEQIAQHLETLYKNGETELAELLIDTLRHSDQEQK